MRVVLLTGFVFCAMKLLAGEPRYAVNTIPEELKKNACAVVREDLMSFTIHSTSSATLHVHFVATIFNGKGKYLAGRTVFYDKLRKITSLKAQVYDAGGSLIKRLKSNEISDQSAFDGLYDDSRVKVADLVQPVYPYTVEFEYDVAYRFLYDIDGSAINPYEDVAVEHAEYQLHFPNDLRPRFKTYNIDQEPEEEEKGGVVSLKWSFRNIAARKFEPYSDYMGAIMRIEAAPTFFEFEGYAGTMNTWNEYGKWIASLNRGRDVLPEETQQRVKAATINLSTTEEKVRALYDLLQSKTRYVSIQLGIGGYQPFEASVVERTGYGDCKALSVYMLAMLEAIGINGHYALIRAGRNRVGLEADFPSSQFNHALVAVPNESDTLWLECTSQINPFGYQGTFTGDRKALLITDNGAAIVNTTRYPAEINFQSTSAQVTVNAAGQATASVKRTYSGLQYENGQLNFIVNGKPDEQKNWIENHFGIPSFDVRTFSMTNVKSRIPSAVVTADLNMDRFATASGKRMFVTPNLMNRHTGVPERIDNRKTEIVTRMAYVDVDTIRYHLPEGMYPEFVPPVVQIRSPFGEYDASFTFDEGEVVYVRRLKVNKGTFPPSTYGEFVEFYRGVNRADNTKLVFLSKT